MATVMDVAAAVLERTGPVDSYKLQKLVYFAQAWYLAWYDEPLFEEDIEAWSNGPVVRRLYDFHRGRYTVSSVPGDADALADQQRRALLAVLDRYAEHSGTTLSEITHAEGPWQVTRAGLPPSAPSDRTIDQKIMAEYYRVYGDSRPVEVALPTDEVVKATARGESADLISYLTGQSS